MYISHTLNWREYGAKPAATHKRRQWRLLLRLLNRAVTLPHMILIVMVQSTGDYGKLTVFTVPNRHSIFRLMLGLPLLFLTMVRIGLLGSLIILVHIDNIFKVVSKRILMSQSTEQQRRLIILQTELQQHNNQQPLN